MQQEPYWKITNLDSRYNLRRYYEFRFAADFSDWMSYRVWIDQAEAQLTNLFGSERAYPHNKNLRCYAKTDCPRWYAGFFDSTGYRIALRNRRDWDLLILSVGEPKIDEGRLVPF